MWNNTDTGRKFHTGCARDESGREVRQSQYRPRREGTCSTSVGSGHEVPALTKVQSVENRQRSFACQQNYADEPCCEG